MPGGAIALRSEARHAREDSRLNGPRYPESILPSSSRTFGRRAPLLAHALSLYRSVFENRRLIQHRLNGGLMWEAGMDS